LIERDAQRGQSSEIRIADIQHLGAIEHAGTHDAVVGSDVGKPRAAVARGNAGEIAEVWVGRQHWRGNRLLRQGLHDDQPEHGRRRAQQDASHWYHLASGLLCGNVEASHGRIAGRFPPEDACRIGTRRRIFAGFD